MDYEPRVLLPVLRDANDRPGLWKVFKSSVGKDITKFSVPVYINEPISMVQKVTEIMENEELLVRANREANSKIRLMLIASMGAAQYCCMKTRITKPFNPILGETYEYCCSKFKYIGEQVSHHPPVTAAYAVSEDYEFYMQTHTKLGLSWGYMKAVPNGLQHVKLKRTGEHFTISRPNTHVKNLVFGQLSIEQVGESVVTNLTTGEVCIVEFKETGWGGKNKHYLEGYTYDSLKLAKAKKKVPSW